MPLTLGRRFAPDFVGRPPHMSDEDFQLWARWYPQQMQTTAALYFDVGVGSAPPIPPGTAPDMTEMWTRLNQKRIDVLMDRTTNWWIVELRHAASANAIGRLLAYQALFEQDKPDDRPALLFLVTDRSDPDLQRIALTQAIAWIIT